jgi:hypothetical protein
MLGDMSAPNNHHETVLAVSMFSTAAFIFLCLLIVSYKTGKMIHGRYIVGRPMLADRKLDPFGYWLGFTFLSLVCAFVVGCDIWIMIHGV